MSAQVPMRRGRLPLQPAGIEITDAERFRLWSEDTRPMPDPLPRCPAGHGPMRLRTHLTSEAAFCGVWYDCGRDGARGCLSSVLLPSVKFMEWFTTEWPTAPATPMYQTEMARRRRQSATYAAAAA